MSYQKKNFGITLLLATATAVGVWTKVVAQPAQQNVGPGEILNQPTVNAPVPTATQHPVLGGKVKQFPPTPAPRFGRASVTPHGTFQVVRPRYVPMWHRVGLAVWMVLQTVVTFLIAFALRQKFFRDMDMFQRGRPIREDYHEELVARGAKSYPWD